MNSLSRIVESSGFNRFITGVILFAAVLIGLETYPAVMERYGPTLYFLNGVVLAVFTLEVALRMGAQWPRPWRYFRDPWNVFDFAIVAASFIPEAGVYAPAVRLLRLLRVLRLIRTVPELQVILGALFRSLPSMGYVVVLMALLLYVYAVAGVFLFGANDPFHFADLDTSLLTLFGVLTLEGWTDILRVQYFGCDRVELPFPEACTRPQAQPFASVLFFLSFVLVATMVFLNLLVGIVVGSMDEMRKSARQEELEADAASSRLAEARKRLAEAQELLESLEPKR